jgi:uroporphyrinogen-III synthase
MIEPVSMKNTEKILKGMSILIMRPKAQSEELARLIQSFGGNPVIFPTIEIKPVEISDNLVTQIKNLDQFKYAIFTSYYAVENSKAIIKRYWPSLPSNLVIAAIGAGTAQALNAAGLPVNLLPKNHFSSEALLQLPAFKKLNGDKIIIFCGKGGRKLLQEQLKQRGANITEFICYQRDMPQLDAKDWDKVTQQPIDIIVCTSVESLKNLFQLIGQDKMQKLREDWMYNTHWLYISERVKNAALELGIITQPLIANKASNKEILNQLIQFAGIKNEKKTAFKWK